ncbi:MAG: hypothetical protein IKY52_09030 [Clostridia bacterium]|nr:hypothetical protein [Clostridia bacterium]
MAIPTQRFSAVEKGFPKSPKPVILWKTVENSCSVDIYPPYSGKIPIHTQDIAFFIPIFLNSLLKTPLDNHRSFPNQWLYPHRFSTGWGKVPPPVHRKTADNFRFSAPPGFWAKCTTEARRSLLFFS